MKDSVCGPGTRPIVGMVIYRVKAFRRCLDSRSCLGLNALLLLLVRVDLTIERMTILSFLVLTFVVL